MKLGIDVNHVVADYKVLGFQGVFERVKKLGLEGMYYKSPLNISPNLDLGLLKEARQCADELGLYLEFGFGRINPFNTNEVPEVWIFGGGNYFYAMERIVQAASKIGCTEMIGVTAGFKGSHKGWYHYDRFRTDVSWEDQILATIKFLKNFSPVLKEHGVRINIETHEEITSFEVVRIVEEVGPDVVGVAFDTGNILARGEEPVAAARRVAPYTHQTHVKDVALVFTETGLARMVMPIGKGVINWEEILPVIHLHDPKTNLTLEDHKGIMPIDLFSEGWRALHPDLQMSEILKLIQFACDCEEKINKSMMESLEKYEVVLYEDIWKERLTESVNYLRVLMDKLNI